MASTVGLASSYRSRTPITCCSRTPVAYCSGTPSPPFGCSSVHELRGALYCLEEELLEPRHHPTTRTSLHFMSEWSGHHQSRRCLVCEGQHPPSSSSSRPAHLQLPSYLGLSPTLGATLRPTSIGTYGF